MAPSRPPVRSGSAARLKDVAQLAGVSLATASKALNDRTDVRATTRARVLSAARKLNFSPNPLAQGLLAGKTGTVGLLTNDLEGRFSLPILMGAEDAFGADSISVLLCDARGDSIRERHHLRSLLDRRVDGLIIVGDTPGVRRSLGELLPIPVVYAYTESDGPRDCSVTSDNVGAGRLGIEHLVRVGRRRIAIITGLENALAASDRVAGARAALADSGLELYGSAPLYGAWRESWGRAATHHFLRSHPDADAVLCGNDQIARGVIDALRENDRVIPDDVAVMGHDNWEPIATDCRPPLTTIDMNLEELGRVASRRLFAAMDGSPIAGTESIPCRLVTRESTFRS